MILLLRGGGSRRESAKADSAARRPSCCPGKPVIRSSGHPVTHGAMPIWKRNSTCACRALQLLQG